MEQLFLFLSKNDGAFIALGLFLAGAAAGVSIFLLFKMRQLTRPFSALAQNTENAEEILPAILRSMDHTEQNLKKIQSTVDTLLSDSRGFFKYISLIRYDAFDDVAGQQSYSLCLLNGEKDGALITYLTGRNSTRSYAVTVASGEASRKLSDEESRALSDALTRETVTAH